MSEISAFHTAAFYDGKNKAASDQQRLCIITFKTPSDRKDDKSYKKPQNVCFSIPKLEVKVQQKVLESAIQALFEELQDSVIRRVVVEKLEASATEGKVLNTVGITVHNDQISFDACARYAAEMAISGKLTKDAINEWFDSNMDDKLTVAIAAALKISDTPNEADLAKLAAAVKQHKELFAGCAATRPNIAPKIAKSLVKALELVEEDRIKISLKEKLEKLANPQDTKFFGL